MKKVFVFLFFIFLTISAVFASHDIDFGPYLKEVQNRIKSNWTPPKEDISKSATVIFSINKDGNLIEEKILKSSKDREYDAIALQTIYLTAPFKPLPAEFEGDKIDIQFTFDYNVWVKSREKAEATAQNSSSKYERQSFDFLNFIKRYEIDYEYIRMIALVILAMFVLGTALIKDANDNK